METPRKSYTRINWKNRPNMTTPLSERLLNIMDAMINTLENMVIDLIANKADKDEIGESVIDVNVDENTWIITFQRKNGTPITIDLPIESTVVNFNVNENNELVLTREDGSTATIDFSRFVFSTENSDTVALTMSNRVIRAEVVDGSITMDKLEENARLTRVIRAEVVDGSITMDKLEENARLTLLHYMEDAQTAAGDSLTYSRDSKRWAVGGVAPGDEQDNSKTYCEQSRAEADRAKIEADKAAQYANITTPDFYVDLETMTLCKKGGSGVTFEVFDDNVLCWKIGAA